MPRKRRPPPTAHLTCSIPPRHGAEDILAPRKGALLERPRLLAGIVAGRPGGDVHGHQVVHGGMGLAGVAARGGGPHPRLALRRRRLDGLFQRVVEARDVRLRRRRAPEEPRFPEVVSYTVSSVVCSPPWYPHHHHHHSQ